MTKNKVFQKFSQINTRFSYMGSQLVDNDLVATHFVSSRYRGRQRTVDTLIEINKIIAPFIHALKRNVLDLNQIGISGLK